MRERERSNDPYTKKIIIIVEVHSCVLLTQCRAGDKIERIEMGGACSTYGRGESCVQVSGGET
jgi:hypothetical protein